MHRCRRFLWDFVTCAFRRWWKLITWPVYGRIGVLIAGIIYGNLYLPR